MASAPTSIPADLRARTQHVLTKSDTLLTRLTHMLTTVAGADKVLLTLYYLLKLLSPQLTRLRKSLASAATAHPNLRPTARAYGSIKQTGPIALLPRDTIVAVLEQEQRALNTSRLARTIGAAEAASKALADGISDYRLFTRLWGLLSIYAWAKGTYKAPPRDGLCRAIVYAQIALGVGFQVFENMAFLALKGVVRGDWAGPTRQKAWWIWSCRFWGGHLVLEAVRLARVKQIQDAEGEREKAVDARGVDDDVRKRKEEELGRWRRLWYGNAAYVPIAMHYSLARGCLSDEQMGFLGLVAGVLGLQSLWKTSGAVLATKQ